MPSNLIFTILSKNKTPEVEDINIVYRLLNGDYDPRRGHGMSVRLTAFDGRYSDGSVDLVRYALEVRNREPTLQKAFAIRNAAGSIIVSSDGGTLKSVDLASDTPVTTPAQVIVHGTSAEGILSGTYPAPSFYLAEEYFRVFPKMIMQWYGSPAVSDILTLELVNAPGWVLCHGQTVTLRDGTTGFTVPNLRNRVAIGVDSVTLGSQAGVAWSSLASVSTDHTHTHSHAMPHDHNYVHTHTYNHTHTSTDHTHNQNNHTHRQNDHNHVLLSHGHTGVNVPNFDISHTHSLSGHTHPIGTHTHNLNSHSHNLHNTHTHSLSAHVHTMNGHTHPLTNSHVHDVGTHAHGPTNGPDVGGTGTAIAYAGSGTPLGVASSAHVHTTSGNTTTPTNNTDAVEGTPSTGGSGANSTGPVDTGGGNADFTGGASNNLSDGPNTPKTTDASFADNHPTSAPTTGMDITAGQSPATVSYTPAVNNSGNLTTEVPSTSGDFNVTQNPSTAGDSNRTNGASAGNTTASQSENTTAGQDPTVSGGTNTPNTSPTTTAPSSTSINAQPPVVGLYYIMKL